MRPATPPPPRLPLPCAPPLPRPRLCYGSQQPPSTSPAGRLSRAYRVGVRRQMPVRYYGLKFANLKSHNPLIINALRVIISGFFPFPFFPAFLGDGGPAPLPPPPSLPRGLRGLRAGALTAAPGQRAPRHSRPPRKLGRWRCLGTARSPVCGSAP